MMSPMLPSLIHLATKQLSRLPWVVVNSKCNQTNSRLVDSNNQQQTQKVF
jgi:hypothetical protein